jgi:hypothetical protein
MINTSYLILIIYMPVKEGHCQPEHRDFSANLKLGGSQKRKDL